MSGRGVGWAFSAGLNAAMAAIAAKSFHSQLDWRWQCVKYALVVFFNVIMWASYVNSLKALSSLQATVVNFATNFLSSGFAGYLFFEEQLSSQWFAGAFLMVLGTFILSQSSIEQDATHQPKKLSPD
ncbi:transmembrane protein 42 [Amborella trichopoda]|uniref:transmembrane protein 42 n=1 Tax=Amborella trichopoda TaxID=13333 RepID=UPI0005D2F642|nr:transmembrane protein 42 [Amborella trichopoda]|eukprot:XP_011621332.1 transmembrane protein 42 [Amborella trichopoda]